ncbi:MAG: hypothetical protein ACLSX5_01630 [Lachnospiraceae bacterium]
MWFKMLFGRFNFSDRYVAAMIKMDDITWKTSEKYLYYCPSNSNWILPSILLGLFCSLGGVLGIMQYCAAWLPFVYFNCHWNNLKLDADEKIVAQRIKYMIMRVQNGEYE